MKTVKELVKDSVFCALICAFIMLFNFLTPADYLYISLIIIVFVGCYFQNKNITRPIISSSVILLLSFLILNSPLYVSIFILPSLVVGIISSALIKTKIKPIWLILILSVGLFAVNMVMEVLFANYIMGVDFFTYVLMDEGLGIGDLLLQFSEVVIVLYFILVATVSFMEILILVAVNKIYKRKIMPILREKPYEKVKENEEVQ